MIPLYSLQRQTQSEPIKVECEGSDTTFQLLSFSRVHIFLLVLILVEELPFQL